ncbi:MAG: YbgC/YbaW family acyl-CoA thioester hydrolase [Chlamydiales bacterium]|jgi:YbgC/YbaW family acyl-CoA thioester hydrolase
MTVFETEFQVRFGHVDPAGIAYFPRIFDYIHDVFEEVWEHHVGQRYYHLLLERRIGFPLVHSDVDFSAPLRFGDRPAVKVTCFRLGRSSLGLLYRVFLDGKLHVEARMTTTCVDLDGMQSIPIPEEFRARFEMIREPESE